MANEWTDPDAPRLGGLSKEQEREVADQLERSFGLNPEWGWLNIPDIVGNASRVYNMSDEDWDKMFKELPYYGQFQDQDINAIQEHFLSKYPLEHIPILSTLAEKYGIDAGTIPSDAAYQKIMSISPDALSGVKATALPIMDRSDTEIEEWNPEPVDWRTSPYEKDITNTGEEVWVPGFHGTLTNIPRMAKGGLLSGAAIVGEAGPELVVGNAEVVPLRTKEEEAFWDNHPDPKFHSAQFTLRRERVIEAAEKAEKERRDKMYQQKWDAERRARQYEAIANRLGT